MALLIALARTPIVRPFLPDSYFRVALVSHVDLLLVVVYLLMPVLLWSELGLLGARVERFTLRAVVIGVAGITASGVAGLGEAVLANYVPFLLEPVFLGGLGVFLAGVGVAAAAAGLGLGRSAAPEDRAAAAAGLSIVGAVLGTAVAVVRAVAGLDAPVGSALSSAFWAGGHLIQFGHVAGMIAAWALLLRWAGARDRDLEPLAWAGYLCTAGVVVGLLAVLVSRPEELGAGAFTALKAWGVGIPGTLAALAAAWVWFRVRSGGGLGLAAVPSGILVLGLGGFIALRADLGVQSTLIPGHYHAELTAVALAYMGYTFSAVARAGVRVEWGWLARWQPYLYGLGTMILVGGMAWAGVHGAPRKTAGTEFARDVATLRALAVWGLGSLLAVAGGAGYVVSLLLTLVRWRPRGAGSDRQAVSAAAQEREGP